MKDFVKNLAALIKVKSLVTFLVVAVWATLAMKQVISATSVENIVLMVLSFYFGTQMEKNSTKEK